MEGGIKATAMLAIGDRSQHFVKERAMIFSKWLLRYPVFFIAASKS